MNVKTVSLYADDVIVNGLDFKNPDDRMGLMDHIEEKRNKERKNKGNSLFERKLEEIIEWARALTEISEKGQCTIIVEGPRDVISLKSLGVRGEFYSVREVMRKIRDGLQDEFNGRAFIILTDFDREGRMLHLGLKSTLTSLGARVIEWPRERYARLHLPPRIEEAYDFVSRRRDG